MRCSRMSRQRRGPQAERSRPRAKAAPRAPSSRRFFSCVYAVSQSNGLCGGMVAQSAERAKRRRILEPLVRSGRGLLRSGLFSVEECAARLECKVQPAIRGHYADGGQHQIYDASPGQFAPVIVHDSPLFPVLTFEGHCGGRRAARLISPQCGAAATPDPRSISSSATGHIGSPSRGPPFPESEHRLPSFARCSW